MPSKPQRKPPVEQAQLGANTSVSVGMSTETSRRDFDSKHHNEESQQIEEPELKRLTLRNHVPDDASVSSDPFRYLSESQNDKQVSNLFTGTGLQNLGGNITVGRDLHIQTVPSRRDEINEEIKIKQLMKSLYFDQMEARQWNISTAHARTCRWILQTPTYLSWRTGNDNPNLYRDPDHNFLWLKGKPGTGKSTMMKFLLAQLQDQAPESNEIVLSFFFNARGHSLEKMTLGLYRTLLLQLLEKCPTVQPVLDELRIEHQWTVESLKYILQKAIQHLGDTPLTCLIDALDECEEAQVRDMVSFLTSLSRKRLFICFASRHYPHITLTGLSLILEHESGHSADIEEYLSTSLRIGYTQGSERLRRVVQEKSSGIFIWVVLVVAILNKEYDIGREDNLQETIQELPGDLYDLFYNLLTHDGYTGNTLLCIQWVLFSPQPLKLEELYYAMICGAEPQNLSKYHSAKPSGDTMKRYILNCSKGLVENTQSKDSQPLYDGGHAGNSQPCYSTVQFIHESVPDFLLKENGLSRIWPEYASNCLGRSHDELKQYCTTYLRMDALDDLGHRESPRDWKSALDEFPFLNRAHSRVLYHAEQAQNHGVGQQEFLASFPQPRWVACYNAVRRKEVNFSPEVSLLYILALEGYAALIRAYSSTQSCFEIEDEKWHIPFIAAIGEGKDTAAAQALLDVQAERLTGLSFAEFCSRWPLDIKFSRDKIFLYGLPMKRGGVLLALMELSSEIVTVFFLETEEKDTDFGNELGFKALNHAVDKGFNVLTELLLQKGAKDSNGSILHFAIGRGNTTAARLLINYNASVITTNENGNTPLHAACAENDGEVAKLLIDKGLDVTATNIDGNTPLHLLKWHSDVAQLLVACGANVSAVNRQGQTPLYGQESFNVAQVLIDHGADLSAVDKDGNTPLHGQGIFEIAKLLINSGADLSAVDKDGNTPLHGQGIFQIAKLLINSGADISAVNEDGSTPLHVACIKGYTRVARLLIDHGASTSAVDKRGNTPLHSACEGDDRECGRVVDLLLSYKADRTAENSLGKTPFQIAQESSNIYVQVAAWQAIKMSRHVSR
ncbi:hypothetical protein F5Y16DRAFT_257717 [Xylariaceae sp. FL0255]|nr:hypothetical protein F5Y16DRAFT_257717 [Xylariaceae sp. FL0255]